MGLLRNPLARMRQRAGFKTAADAADKLQCSRIHLLNIERGAAGASESLLKRISLLYSQPPDAIREVLRASKIDLLSRLQEAAREDPK